MTGPPPRTPAACEFCGTSFLRYRMIYCSESCRDKAKRPRVKTAQCRECGKGFQWETKQGVRRYCSADCRRVASYSPRCSIGYAECSYCGKLHVRHGRPSGRRRTFCPRCRGVGATRLDAEYYRNYCREYGRHRRDREQVRAYRQRVAPYANERSRLRRQELQRLTPSDRNGTPWTAAEDAIAASDDRSILEMCFMLNRSHAAVSGHRADLARRRREANA